MKTIYVPLSEEGIEKAKQELIAYKDRLKTKCEQLVSRLADEGISVAKIHSTGELGSYITFEKKVNVNKYSASAVMIATSDTVTSEWMTYDGVKSADISPLLMLEFGSGAKASDASGKANAVIASSLGMGRGTFPDQTHAFDIGGWWWKDLQDNWHHSNGTEPTMPVFNALLKMESIVVDIAREVFDNDD